MICEIKSVPISPQNEKRHMAVLALLCFGRAYSVRLGFFCILGGILLVVYTIRINSLSQIAVVVPVILILIKEIFHHQIWSGLWPTILLIILTIIIWAADVNLLKVKDSTFSVLGIIRFVLALITTFLCAYNFVRRMTGFTQLVSTYEYSVYEFGMLFMEIALLEIFGPCEKYSGRIRGSMIIVVAGLYLAAIVLCCIGFALAENFQEAVSTLNEGANLFGDYLMNYALQEAGEGISMGFLKTMLAVSIAVICEGFVPIILLTVFLLAAVATGGLFAYEKFFNGQIPWPSAIPRLSAIMKKDCTVTFDLGDDSSDNAPAPQTIEYGKTAAEPDDPFRDGFMFLGWYTKRSGARSYDFTEPVKSSITLTAKWLDPTDTKDSDNY